MSLANMQIIEKIKEEPLQNFVKEDKLLSVVKLFVCKLCKKKFTTKNLLKSHVAQVHKQSTKIAKNVQQCEHCNQSFKNINLLVQHKLLAHSDTKKYYCDECNQSFTFKHDLYVHMKNHKLINNKVNSFDSDLQIIINVYACDFCSKTFTDPSEYEKHVIEHSKPKKKKIIRVAILYVCEVCQMKYKNRREYKVHLKTHKTLLTLETESDVLMKNQVDETLQCEYCNVTSDSMSKAITHKHRFHPFMPNYYCRICGKLFPLKIAIDNHNTSVHVQDDIPKIDLTGKYECNVCQVEFLTESALERHIKTAHVSMQFWPNSGFFPSPSTKIVQGNTTELFSIYYCHLCGSDYILKHNLKQHLLRDHSEAERNTKPPDRIIRCVVCTAKFFTLKAFQTHQLNHSNSDLYVANEEERQRIVNRIDQDFDINRVPGLF